MIEIKDAYFGSQYWTRGYWADVFWPAGVFFEPQIYAGNSQGEKRKAKHRHSFNIRRVDDQIHTVPTFARAREFMERKRKRRRKVAMLILLGEI